MESDHSLVMAGIGCAVVDVVGVFAWIAEQLDIVTDGVFAMGVNRRVPALALYILAGQARELFKEKSRHGEAEENALTPSFSKVM